MHIKHHVKAFFIATVLIFSLACCMLPTSYEGSIQQNSQEGFIFYDNGVQELTLKVSPEISGKKELKQFCWLITVPNEPDHYEVVDFDIFRQLYKLKRKHLEKPKSENIGCTVGCSVQMEAKAAEAVEGVELGRRAKAGPYDIQPVRGVGKNALSGLNTWLTRNGFPTEPENHMKYFVDNKFTFLCIKVNPADQESKISPYPSLNPLRLTFKSDSIYYPMKYSSQQGEFSVNLYTLTTKPIDYKLSADTLERIDWKNKNLFKNVDLQGYLPTQHLQEILSSKANTSEQAITDEEKTGDSKKSLKEEKYPHLYFNNFQCHNPNSNGAISTWQEDVFLKLNNSHLPNDSNMMGYQQMSLPAVCFLIVITVLFFKALQKRFRRREVNDSKL